LEREDVLGAVVRSVRAIHAGPPIPSSFPVFRIVEDYRAIAAERGVAAPPAFDQVHAKAGDIEAALSKHPLPDRPCHNDLLNANFLLDGDHVWIVDYEYGGMGDLFFDLGNLSINNGLSAGAQETLLRLYFGDVTEAHRGRLQLMRIMSDFREAMWGVVQQAISTLDFDYVDYADRHFTRCLANASDDRFDGWLRAAAAEPV
jgi:thiamine kinase-like enzyme